MIFLNKRDKFYFWYFLIHIPITILIDSCIIVPTEYQLGISKALLDFHIGKNKDFLLVDLPIWFKVFGLFELVFQLPLFFVASSYLARGIKGIKIYPWMIIYGFNAFFTTLVCLVYIYNNGSAKELSSAEVYNLIGLYVPYLIIPFVILVDFTRRTTHILGQKTIKIKEL